MQSLCIEKRFAFRASEIADSRIRFNRWLLSPNRRAKKLTKIPKCLPCQKLLYTILFHIDYSNDIDSFIDVDFQLCYF